MPSINLEAIKPLATKYIWWKSPDEAIDFPERVAAQVMNIGDFDDVQMLVNIVGKDYLKEIIQHAEIGMFDERSWTYWHYKLGLSKPNQRVSSMPKRRLA